MEVQIYQALAIKHALRLYAKCGVKANRDYTPKNMLSMAGKITGQAFKPRDYEGAARALESWVERRLSNG